MDVATKAQVDVGSKLTIKAGAMGDAAPQVLITGEVTALEGEYRHAKAPTLVIRGYDATHRLMRGRVSKVFRQSKYSDVARQVAGAAGLEIGTIDDSGMVFEYVYQHNQTDLEFLRSLAKLVGFEAGVADGKFVFRKPVPASGAPPSGDFTSRNALELVFGQDLEEFRPRITAGGQVKKVTVRGWDMKQKAALVAEKPASTESAHLPDNPASLAGKFGDSQFTSIDQPHASQQEVNSEAEALIEQIGSAFAEATGKARGNPRIKAGSPVSISLVAAKFQGGYTLTHTRHTYDLREGYRTHFEVSGRQERSLLGLATGGTGGGASGGGAAGVQVGIVTDIERPGQARPRPRQPPVCRRRLRDRLGPGDHAGRGTGPGPGLDPRGQRRGPGGLRPRQRARAIRHRGTLERQGRGPQPRDHERHARRADVRQPDRPQDRHVGQGRAAPGSRSRARTTPSSSTSTSTTRRSSSPPTTAGR